MTPMYEESMAWDGSPSANSHSEYLRVFYNSTVLQYVLSPNVLLISAHFSCQTCRGRC